VTNIARAARYPQPRAASAVLSELQAGFCEHGGVPGRCPTCRAAAEPIDDRDSPEPPAPRPPRHRSPRTREGDDPGPADGQLW
jgi:hypothetical protein